jgi:hydrogenase maturation protease
MKKEIIYTNDLYKKRTCIAGIGNTLRSDDGVGAYVCQLIEEKNLEGVTVIITQQPDIGITEDLVKFDTVIFVDATLKDEAISFKPLSVESDTPQLFSHHINAAMLVSLARILYATNTRFYICAIGGNNFEMGNTLSEKTRKNAIESVSFLTEWIRSNN